jgi:hypothetical protein
MDGGDVCVVHCVASLVMFAEARNENGDARETQTPLGNPLRIRPVHAHK